MQQSPCIQCTNSIICKYVQVIDGLEASLDLPEIMHIQLTCDKRVIDVTPSVPTIRNECLPEDAGCVDAVRYEKKQITKRRY